MIQAFQAPMTRIERAGLVAGLLLALVLLWPVRGALQDDAFVHLQYARHLSSGEGLVFNHGERVYACTSPLWVSLVADGMALGLPGPVVARLLGLAATLASIALFLQLVRRTLGSPPLRAFATVTWASNAWMIGWSSTGMETALAVALTLAGFVAFTEGKQWGSRPVRTSALWGLACLARPELVFLVVLWFAVILIDAQNREGVRRLVFGILPAAVIYGAWLGFARLYYGTFWPLALSAKSDRGGGALGLVADQLRVVASTDVVPLAVLLGGLVVARRRAWAARPAAQAQGILPWAWIVLLPALYASRGIEPQSRYLLVLLPILEWLAWRTLEIAWNRADAPLRPSRRLAALGALVCVLTVTQNVAFHRARIVPDTQASARELEAGPLRWGAWFARHSHADAVVATPAVGAIGYASGRRVFDLQGLVTPEMTERLGRESLADAIARFRFARFVRPDLLVDRAAGAGDHERRSPYARVLRRLGSSAASRGDIGDPSREVDTYYRIDWAAFDSLTRASPPR